jgi:ADP-ribose pyrophosphatase YjhB (NUDIX family)
MLTCTFEDGGNTTNLRHATVAPLVIRDNEILLVKRAPHLTCGNLYGLPGGYMDKNETIMTAAAREVFEETGYQTSNPIIFLINDLVDRKQEDRQNLDIAVILTALEKTGIPDDESSEVAWFPLDDLPKEVEFAFDHYDIIKRYITYVKNPCPLPITDFSYEAK